MSLVVKGVFQGTLPWLLVGVGIFAALSVELLGIHSLPFAVGLYLPLELSTSLFVGGLAAWAFGHRENGVLFSSGLVAGDAIMGILLALWIATGKTLPVTIESRVLSILVIIILFVLIGWRARGRTDSK